MDTLTLTVLVASAISLMGFLVNLHVARETRSHALAQLRLASRLEEQNRSMGDIKEFLACSENLRYTCIRLQRTLSAGDTVDAGKLQSLSELIIAYREQQKPLFTYWFRVIIEIRSETTLKLAGIMHDGTSLCAIIQVSLEMALSDLNKQTEALKRLNPDDQSRIIDNLEVLIKSLERLNALIIDERDSLARDLWQTDIPTKAIEHIEAREHKHASERLGV